MRTISRQACVRIAVAIALLGSWSAGAAEPPAAAKAPEPAPALAPSNAEGLWQGTLLYKKAELEADVLVELARDAKGKWVGTIDVPNQQMKFHPLDNIRIDGSAVYFEFNRFAQKAQVMVETPFTGTLSADGSTITGDFYEGKKSHLPLTLKKIGGPGSERPEPRLAEVRSLSPDGEELRTLFNRDAGKVRLVLLLSPT
jgi:hypothetical protein